MSRSGRSARITIACLSAAAVLLVPATAGAVTQPAVKPVARIFSVTPKRLTSGSVPRILFRVDGAAPGVVRARLLFTPVKGQGTRLRVNLGEVEGGLVLNPSWPAGKVLQPGRYKVKLLATDANGASLARPIGSRATLTVRVSPAALASSVAGGATAAEGGTVAGAPPGTGVGARMVALAQLEVGQRESPDGSNNSPRIAEYRSATPGGPIGPWCAYFTSWLARQAGVPVGDFGQGYGRVDDLYAWARRVGKAMPAATAVPQAGDFMVWDEHIGIVESVNADGTITTIDGNYNNAVTRRVLTPTQRKAVIGYVRL
jgi:hypothetical protein